jgi:hypothetical protein
MAPEETISLYGVEFLLADAFSISRTPASVPRVPFWFNSPKAGNAATCARPASAARTGCKDTHYIGYSAALARRFD